MGGIIAAFFSSGMSPEEIEDIFLRKTRTTELVRLADIAPNQRGLFEGFRIRTTIEECLHGTRLFEQLRFPLALIAVDLNTSKEIVFRHGDLIPAIMATSAFPGVFPPIEHDGYLLVDGGILNNLPVDRVREMGADIVIAVDVLFQVCDVSAGWRMSIPVPGILEEMYRAELIVQAEYSRVRLAQNQPDILISPPIPASVGFFLGFTNAKKIISAGEIAATQALPLIRRLL